jgi:type IX secretion system substrate protein
MMKKLYTPIILFLFLVFSLTVKSQNLGIDSNSFNLGSLPDTINLNDNYIHNITVQNKSAVPLTGTIYLVAAIDSSGGALISIDTVGTRIVTNFGLNDTVGISYNEIYNVANGYKTGGNIIVVWPVASFGVTVDTLRKYVTIINAISVNEINKLYNNFSVYPNPSKNYIHINQYDKIKVVKRVRIFDVHGRMVYEDEFKSKIDISTLSKGIYFLQLEMKNEEELYFKLIKQ